MEANERPKATLAMVGSICLTDIPKEVIKVVETKTINPATGKPYVRKFLNLAVLEYTDGANQYGATHFISCAPKKEERIEGRNYIIGNFKRWEQKQEHISQEQINNAPTMSAQEIEESEDLPF